MRVVEDGKPAVLFNVYEQPDGNAVQIAGAVRDKLAAFKLPPGVRLVNWYDQSELVTQSAAQRARRGADRPGAGRRSCCCCSCAAGG